MGGVMIIIGAMLGFCVAFSAQAKLVSLGLSALGSNKPVIMLFYTVFVAGTVAIFRRKKHVKGLAVLSAAIGGALVASALSWFVTDLAVQGFVDASAHGLQP